MNKLTISPENKKLELAIQDEVNGHIDNFDSFYFDAGAGAGKTYSLIKTIEHILEGNSERLTDASQKILCITYTNAAKNEIITRIGHNSSVVVTTIHEFLWDFIGRQQPLLIQQHERKIEEELFLIEDKLTKNKLYSETDDVAIFDQLVLTKTFMTQFFNVYNKGADDFRHKMNEYINTTPLDANTTLKNVGVFKKLITQLNNQIKLQIALDELKFGRSIHIEYKPTSNRDRLSKFIISHDTLLEYSKEIITNTTLLQRLFSDKYPYVLVDEYQDTDEKVIDTLESILNLSKERKVQFLIGYFGDYMQSIYETGVGNIKERTSNALNQFKVVKKTFNRRSSVNIISLIEKIRNDEFGQVSIYDNFINGQHRFQKINQDEFDLSSYLANHQIDNGACLIMKNKDIAKERGFEKLYNSVEIFPNFKGANYDTINSEFLTKNLQNMGWFFRELLELIEFIIIVQNQNSTVSMITRFMGSSSQLTYGRLEELLTYINEVEICTLTNCIDTLSGIIGESKALATESRQELNKIIENIFSLESQVNYLDQIKESAHRYFIRNEELMDEEVDENKKLIDSFFELDIRQFIHWYYFIKDDGKDEGINYYTLHGSKGLEFDNVVLVLQNNFDRRKDYIQFYFDNYNNRDISDNDLIRFNQVRNLLYVACSRAKKNLDVVYLTDNLKGNEEINIRDIFEEGEVVL
ncbi:UvrD-helicase domain-containing protein [Fundicoccus ignavus]|uniref:DNA 3'-5' helicase n=1 Tax=Fundicoccus ignavus TaxID=2664442 RepID=A0A844CKY1_9LACT|nr:ATP-dependent helicase [Fundicoccus ignavus]MRJ48435.1 AAA family ATPase [Fundicoccus ignavus]